MQHCHTFCNMFDYCMKLCGLSRGPSFFGLVSPFVSLEIYGQPEAWEQYGIVKEEWSFTYPVHMATMLLQATIS